MAQEIDSFVVKFKNLWKAGRNASLILKVDAGKAEINLCVKDIDEPPRIPFSYPRQSRNGPARQRRRERRALARQQAEEASGETNVVNEVAVEASAKNVTAVDSSSKSVVNEDKSCSNQNESSEKVDLVEVSDEFCSNADYVKNEPSSRNATVKQFSVLGEYKNPKFRPFEKLDPQAEVKTLWEAIKKDNKEKGIEEIGEGSTSFEHCFEFWGVWKMNEEKDEKFLADAKNWPKGIKIVEVKPK